MTTLEEVTRMKRQGVPDDEIVNELSQRGISLREINDALKQAQIKYAVTSSGGDEELQPSMMEEEVPSPQTYQSRSYEQQQEYNQEQYAPEQEYQPQEYPQEQYAAPQQEQYYQPGAEQYAPAGIDTDTVMEIADQIFSDKIKKIQKQVDALTESSSLLQTKTENISERLKKIENVIDKLQIAILDKVGSYGKNLEGIRKEMSMMQDSFSKMISPSKRIERKREEPVEETEEVNENEEEIEKPGRKISKKK